MSKLNTVWEMSSNKGTRVPEDLLKYTRDVNSDLDDSFAFKDYSTMTEVTVNPKHEGAKDIMDDREVNKESQDHEMQYISMYHSLKQQYRSKLQDAREREKKYGYKSSSQKCFKDQLVKF